MMNPVEILQRGGRAAAAAGLAVLMAASARAAQESSNDIMGYWETPGGESIVEVTPCQDGQADLCGHIEWLNKALGPDGEPRTDIHNPDRDMRGQPLIGRRILSGFEQHEPGVWSGGGVYNPDDGRTYRGQIRSIEAGTLELEGCALRIFCKDQIWARISAEDPRLDR